MSPAALFDVGTLVVALLIALVFYPAFIRVLRRMKSGQVIQEELPETHQRKAGTPTGGGILFVLVGILASMTTNVEYWNWYEFPGMYVAGYITTQILGYALVGLVAAALVKSESAARS